MDRDHQILAPERYFGWDADPDTRPDELLEELARVALSAAGAASEILRRGANVVRDAGPRTDDGFGVANVETKISATDMVSDVDRESEREVSRIICSLRPDDELVGEEGTDHPGTTGIRWVVDPLDGTTNFLFGVPQFSVSIAAEIDARPVAGVVLDPSHREVWTAVAGHGSFLNGRRCRVPSGRSTVDTALVATGFGYRPERRRWQAEVVARILPEVRDIRRFGSAALDLAWVGGGRFDAYYEWGLNPWDFSAGSLVAAEAGAVVQIMPNRQVVAAPPELFDDFVALLERAGALVDVPGPEPAI